MLAFVQTKTPIVSISTIYQGSTFNVINSKAKLIEKAEDLTGKTVGLASVGGTSDILLELILARVA